MEWYWDLELMGIVEMEGKGEYDGIIIGMQ